MNEALWRIPLAVLIWPGLAGSAVLGWFLLWWGRKLVARLQARQGPPFFQPFYDFVKLLGKDTVVPTGVNPLLFYALPVIALVSTIFALALIPAPGSPLTSFSGDLILLLYLLEMPALCDALAGFITRSLYGQIGSVREMILSLGYNLPFLTALIALALQAGQFSLRALTSAPLGLVHVLAALAILLAIPARLKTNPFSIPNAESEIVAGVHVEYNGLPLALFELSHALELVALTGLFAMLFVNRLPAPAWGALAYVLIGGLLVALTSLLASATARLKVQHALRFYWTWGALSAVLALAAALLA